MKAELLGLLEKFKGNNVLVIGDVMLDKYIWGDVKRISPEAPVQVLNAEREDFIPGGTANVANNLATLGGNVFLIGLVGNDNAKTILSKELEKRNINSSGIFTDHSKPTIQKIRMMARSQQLLRVDYEDCNYIGKDFEDKIIEYIKDVIKDMDAVVISDYAKGVITENIVKSLMNFSKELKIPFIVDPKPKHKNLYKDATVITPNHEEVSKMTEMKVEDEEDVVEAGNKLLKELGSNVLITKREKGMSLFEKEGDVTHIPTKAQEVYDVSGAGDTVVAALALALASGAELKKAALLSNYAAGIAVGKVGTSSVSAEEIKEVVEKDE